MVPCFALESKAAGKKAAKFEQNKDVKAVISLALLLLTLQCYNMLQKDLGKLINYSETQNFFLIVNN